MLELASKMLTLFLGDNRKIMQQLSKGYGTSHLGPLSLQDIIDHLNGTRSNAIYLLDQNQNCSTVCFDIDIPKIEIPSVESQRQQVKLESFLPEVRKIIDYLRDIYHVSSKHLLVEDTGGRGYHVWAFFAQPVEGQRCVTFLNDVKLNCGFSGLEIFPPAFNQGNKGFSKSLVRLPLGLHRAYANSRSRFLNPDTFEPIPFDDLSAELAALKYLESEVLNIAEGRYNNLIDNKAERATRTASTQRNPISHSPTVNLGEVGELISKCPALLDLENKAKHEGNLKHHERFALAAILKNFQDGEALLHKILSSCDNYDLERSIYQIGTIKGCAISCKKLQSPSYGICKGWCNTKFKESAEYGRQPSPVWFADLNKTKEEILLDNVHEDISQVASIANLSTAWKKAQQQAIDRDIFQDKMGFSLFEKDIWNNLAMLGIQLNERRWKHNNFLSIKIPKDKASGAMRPFCSVSARESVVQLAVMNVIGPKIDSRFHRRSLGNRLAISPKTDDQIFQDWRKQNAIREFKKNSFSEYEPHNHYVLLDIRKFYEFIKHGKLLLQIRQFVDDQFILEIIDQYIKAPWERTTGEYKGQKKTMGIPQGPALSALLANIYLNDIDHWLSERCIDFVRYVDDLAILFEDKQTADLVLNELEEMLSQDYGLSLNTEKTVGPLPITDNEKLSTWLDRVKYDFVRSGVTNSANITENQKQELFETLNKVAGNIDEDPKKLTKSLGFYVRFSERLDSAELTNTVYKVAEYLLEEDRPRHNATCIAVRALIKASNEPYGNNWPAFKSLMQKRGDDYIKIVFAQECAGLLGSVDDFALRGEIVDELCSIAISHESPVAAAAAIDTLLTIDPDLLKSLDVNALKELGFGGFEMLRPRAIALLFYLKEIDETSLARIGVKTLFELEVYGNLIKESAYGLFKELVRLTLLEYTFQLCLPLLVRKGILLKNKEGTQLFSQLNGKKDQRNLANYIADKIISDLVMDESLGGNIITMLDFLKETGEITIASELYLFAKYSKWLKDCDDFLEFQRNSNEKNYIGFSEPFIRGVEILEPFFESNRFVQKARETDTGRGCFHELVKDQELAKSGRNINAYLSAFNELIKADLLLESKTEIRSGEGKLLIKTVLPAGTKSLFDYMSGRDNEPQTIHYLLSQISSHVDLMRRVLAKISESILIPVPTLHTVFIDVEGNIRSGLTGLTIGSERRFVGRSGACYMLQADEWLVETIGLLFFELHSGGCAVKEFTEIRTSSPNSINAIGLSHGRLLLDILLKSTRATPSLRYALTKYQLEEIEEWAKLQTAINLHPTMSAAEQRILNALWSMDLKIKRYIAKDLTGEKELIDFAFGLLHNKIVKQLKDSELYLEPFLVDCWKDISWGELYDRHVAATQAITIAKVIDNKVATLKSALSLNREISFTKWLVIAAAGIELEALRRSCQMLAREASIQIGFNEFISFAETNGTSGIDLSYINKGEPFIDEIIALLQENLAQACHHLKTWLATSDFQPANWKIDLLVIQFVVLAKFYGLRAISSFGEVYELKANKKLFNPSKVNISLYKILAVYRAENSTPYHTSEGFGLEYKGNLMAGINEISLHIVRGMYRDHDRLHLNITGKIRFAQLVKLNIRHHRMSVELRGNLVIEKVHNDFDALHTINCPFSIDMQRLNGKLQPLTATFPIVTYSDIEQRLYPQLQQKKQHLLGLHGVIFQRKNPVTSAFLDVHIVWLIVAFFLTWIASLWVLEEKSAWKQSSLNIFIYGTAFLTLCLYLGITFRRLRAHSKTLAWVSDSLTR